MMVLTHTDFPDPVVPPINRCGMVVRSTAKGVPSTSRPSATASGDLLYTVDKFNLKVEESQTGTGAIRLDSHYLQSRKLELSDWTLSEDQELIILIISQPSGPSPPEALVTRLAQSTRVRLKDTLGAIDRQAIKKLTGRGRVKIVLDGVLPGSAA